MQSRLSPLQTLPQISGALQLPHHLRSQYCNLQMKVSEFHSWDCWVAIATTGVATNASATDLNMTLEIGRSYQPLAH